MNWEHDPNTRPLLDDEIDEPLEEPAVRDAREELASKIPLYEAVTAPEWAAMAAYLAGLEQEATDRMIASAGSSDFIRYQTRVRLLRELQELPAILAQQIRLANERLERTP